MEVEAGLQRRSMFLGKDHRRVMESGKIDIVVVMIMFDYGAELKDWAESEK